MELSDLESVTVPRKDNSWLKKVAKRTESCRSIGMFRSNNSEFLLCYDAFGLYVDDHGNPSRGMNTVEWEGTAGQVAWHPPYILLFDSRFIEIRHVDTGRLVQILPGNGMRCICDGRGTRRSQPVLEGSQGRGVSQEPGIHVVTNKEATQFGRGEVTTEYVFGLIPTPPMLPPGSPPSYTPHSQSN